MVQLNLTAQSADQKILLQHLTPLVSDVLAEKINNGVRITKEGKELISKKDLNSFMEYLIDEVDKMKIAKKYKRANVAGMEGEEIIKHALHYFEEDSIEGSLFNLDGTEYKTPKPTKKYSEVKVVAAASEPPKPKPKPQLSIFDMFQDNAESAKPETPSTPIIPEIKQREGSPMYQHYQSVKEKYQDCILFYRLGDFYEMFNGDAITAADVLNLTLTGRDCGLAERVPMTGVPFHAADAYISKLVMQGYKVAVVERLDGDYEKTVERVIAANPAKLENLVDVETGEIISNEDLSEDEMREFDGDIDELEEIPTISKILGDTDKTEEQDETDDFDLQAERERLKAFDRNAIVILSDIFGDVFNLE